MFDFSKLPKPWNVLRAFVLIMATSMIIEPPAALWVPTIAMPGFAVRAYAADMETKEWLPADLEQPDPTIGDPPPGDLKPSQLEIEQPPPADLESTEPEVEQPSPADFESSDPEVEEPEE